MTTRTYIFLFVLAVAGGISAQSGCPGCLLDLPAGLAEDTIFLSETPNGSYGEYYEADLSFRMPRTTTPVANNGGNVPAGLNIGSIEIVNVLNVPPGLSWEPSASFFEVIEGETDGCVRFCGTPLLVDSFVMEVVLRANLFISTETSVFVSLVVDPAVSSNDGFTLINNAGCGSVTADFINNVASNGEDGFSYFWDFGNGDTSTVENPGSIVYDSPGVYPIDYTATIDTTGYFISGITVLETGCTDLISNPDLKVNIFDPDGNYIYTTQVIDNTDTPVSYSLFLEIGEGTYAMQVVDDDGGIDGADDDCGTIFFTREQDGTFSVGDLILSFTIFHPVEMVTGTDTVIVLAQPDVPQFDDLPFESICAGDSVRLEVLNYQGGLSWSLDSFPLGLPDSQSVLYVMDTGRYEVIYTSPDGCLSSAVAPSFEIVAPPDSLLVQSFNNLIQADSAALPPNTDFIWLLDGEEIDETRLRFCATQTGLYTLVITDVATRCSASSSVFVNFDPDKPCDVTSVREAFTQVDWRVYPSPGNGPLTISGELAERADLLLKLTDVSGRTLFQQATTAEVGNWQLQLELPQLPAGVYYLLLTGQRETIALPVIRR